MKKKMLLVLVMVSLFLTSCQLRLCKVESVTRNQVVICRIIYSDGNPKPIYTITFYAAGKVFKR